MTITQPQLDAAIKHLLEQSSHYTSIADPKGGDAQFNCNMITSMVLAGIAGALIEARKATPRFYRNEEEED
jgi:hypothetical protein